MTAQTQTPENHHGAAKAADERAVGLLKGAPALLFIAVVFVTGVMDGLVDFTPAGMLMLDLGVFAAFGAGFAAINSALKKRMTADAYAAWQVSAMKIALFVLFAGLLGFSYLAAVFASFSLAAMMLFFLCNFLVYLAAGAMINNALKKRMPADDYAEWIKEIHLYDICLIGFAGFFAFVGLAVFTLGFGHYEVFIYGLLGAAAIVAALMMFRAMLKKTMTAEVYSTLPPMFSFVFFIALDATDFIF